MGKLPTKSNLTNVGYSPLMLRRGPGFGGVGSGSVGYSDRNFVRNRGQTSSAHCILITHPRC